MINTTDGYKMSAEEFAEWIYKVRQISKKYEVFGTDNEATTLMFGLPEEFLEVMECVEIPKEGFAQSYAEELGDFVNYAMQVAFHVIAATTGKDLIADEEEISVRVGQWITCVHANGLISANGREIVDIRTQAYRDSLPFLKDYLGTAKRIFRGDTGDYNSKLIKAIDNLLTVAFTTSAMFGTNMLKVSKMNLSKLEGRSKRDTLTGQGVR